MANTYLQQVFVLNLKAARRERGLTQDQLGENAGVSSNHIAMIESGRRFPSVAMIEKISTALGINAYELFIEEDVTQKDLGESIKRVYIRRLKGKLNEFIDQLDL